MISSSIPIVKGKKPADQHSFRQNIYFIDSNYWRNPKLFWLKKPVTIDDLTFDEIHNLRREIWGQLSVDTD